MACHDGLYELNELLLMILVHFCHSGDWRRGFLQREHMNKRGVVSLAVGVNVLFIDYGQNAQQERFPDSQGFQELSDQSDLSLQRVVFDHECDLDDHLE